MSGLTTRDGYSSLSLPDSGTWPIPEEIVKMATLAPENATPERLKRRRGIFRHSMWLLVICQMLLWSAPAIRGWDVCDATGGLSPRTGGKRMNLQAHALMTNLGATLAIVQVIVFRYMHESSGDDTPVMWRVLHAMLASSMFLLTYTAEVEVIWCWPGRSGDILAAFILPVSIAAEGLQRAFFMRAIRKRVKLTEIAYEKELGAGRILLAWKIVVVAGMLAALVAIAGAWAFAASYLKQERMGKLNALAYAIFETISFVCQTVTAVVSVVALRRVSAAASRAAQHDRAYVRAEATWAVKVLGRLQVATAGPCFIDGVASGCVAAATFLVEVAGSEELPYADKIQGNVLLFATSAPVLFDSLGLFLIVGLFQPSEPEIDMGDMIRAQSGSGSGIPLSGNAEWDETVCSLANRSIELADILDLYDDLASQCCEEMPHYDPEHSTTNDVVRQVIIPRSRQGSSGDAYALLVSKRSMPPDRMVTHCWDKPFLHIVAAAVADAQHLTVYGLIAKELAERGSQDIRRTLRDQGTLRMSFWICAFCVNQHAHICHGQTTDEPPDSSSEAWKRWDGLRRDSTTNELLPTCSCSHPKYTSAHHPARCELNKFDYVMGLMSRNFHGIRHLVVSDRELKIFSRAWCVAELVESHASGMPVNFCVESASFMNVLGDLETYTRVANVRVQDCLASREEDKEFILKRIPEKERFNAQLQKIIFGRHGLLGQKFEGFGLAEAAVRVARRTDYAMRMRSRSHSLDLD